MDTGIILPTNGIKKRQDNSYAGKPLAEIVVNGFFTVDKKWTVQYWNKAAEKILKVKAADIIGKNLWDAFAGYIPIEFYAVYHKAFEKTVPVHFREYWGEMGAWFDVITYYCDNTLSVSFKSSNRSVDPEFPTTLEQQLQVKTTLYKFIAEVTNDCLWEWDLVNQELFWIDGGHKRVFGYDVENALIPQNFWEDQIHPEDKSRILAKLKNLLRKGSVTAWENEYRFKRAGGDYAWVRDKGHIIYEDGEARRMIGATQDITEKVLLEKQLAAERLTRQRETTSTVLTAQEKERVMVGTELMDNVNQVLGAARWQIEMAKSDTINHDTLLETSSQYILQVMQTVSRISKALSPPFMQAIGLVKSMKILTDDAAEGYPVRFTINDYGVDLSTLDEKLQMDIFRIVQQQVDNILQHAGATLATIDISLQDDEIVLFISDNGQGCDLTERTGGTGIKNMITRSGLYHGSVTSLSNPGEGYTLQAIFRLDD